MNAAQTIAAKVVAYWTRHDDPQSRTRYYVQALRYASRDIVTATNAALVAAGFDPSDAGKRRLTCIHPNVDISDNRTDAGHPAYASCPDCGWTSR